MISVESYVQFHSEIFSAKPKEFMGRQMDHPWWDLGSPGGFMGRMRIVQLANGRPYISSTGYSTVYVFVCQFGCVFCFSSSRTTATESMPHLIPGLAARGESLASQTNIDYSRMNSRRSSSQSLYRKVLSNSVMPISNLELSKIELQELLEEYKPLASHSESGNHSSYQPLNKDQLGQPKTSGSAAWLPGQTATKSNDELHWLPALSGSNTPQYCPRTDGFSSQLYQDSMDSMKTEEESSTPSSSSSVTGFLPPISSISDTHVLCSSHGQPEDPLTLPPITSKSEHILYEDDLLLEELAAWALEEEEEVEIGGEGSITEIDLLEYEPSDATSPGRRSWRYKGQSQQGKVDHLKEEGKVFPLCIDDEAMGSIHYDSTADCYEPSWSRKHVGVDQSHGRQNVSFPQEVSFQPEKAEQVTNGDQQRYEKYDKEFRQMDDQLGSDCRRRPHCYQPTGEHQGFFPKSTVSDDSNKKYPDMETKLSGQFAADSAQTLWADNSELPPGGPSITQRDGGWRQANRKNQSVIRAFRSDTLLWPSLPGQV